MTVTLFLSILTYGDTIVILVLTFVVKFKLAKPISR
jgi:hypothetical protein